VGRVTRRHTRFALRDVTFAGVALPGATVDAWEDDSGRAQWSARLVTRIRIAAEEGELAGHTADGRLVTGPVVVADRDASSGRPAEALIEFHGSGELIVREPEATT